MSLFASFKVTILILKSMFSTIPPSCLRRFNNSCNACTAGSKSLCTQLDLVQVSRSTRSCASTLTLFVWLACDISGFIFASLCHLSMKCYICGNTLPPSVSAEQPVWLRPWTPAPMVLNYYFVWSGGCWFWDHLDKSLKWIKWVLIILWLVCREHKPPWMWKQMRETSRCCFWRHLEAQMFSCQSWHDICHFSAGGVVSLKFDHNLCFKLKSS